MITLLQALVFGAYVGFIYKKFGKLTSISASTYELDGRNVGWFPAFLMALGGLNVLQPMDWYGFVATAFLWLTGITIWHVSGKMAQKQIHTIASISAIVFSFLGLILVHGLFWPMILFGASILVVEKYDSLHRIWWYEISAFFFIILSYLTF